jgi:hypothetical protein
MKLCKNCDKLFKPVNKYVKFCSRSCASAVEGRNEKRKIPITCKNGPEEIEIEFIKSLLESPAAITTIDKAVGMSDNGFRKRAKALGLSVKGREVKMNSQVPKNLIDMLHKTHADK